MGIMIEGVAMVDLTETDARVLDEIVCINGAATVLLSTRTARALTSAGLEGCANVIVLPDGAVWVRGTSTVDAAHLLSLSQPVSYYLDGGSALVFSQDVEQGLLERQVTRIMGEEGYVVCPPSLRGCVERLRRSSANVLLGPCVVTRGPAALDVAFLAGMADGTRLVHLGRLTALDALPAGLLLRRLSALDVRGKLVIRAGACSALGERVIGPPASVEVIPDDARYFPGDLLLDEAFLDAAGPSSLWVAGSATVMGDVDEELLRRCVRALRARSIICPRRLVAAVGAVTGGSPVPDCYRDQLVTFEGRYDLEAADLDGRKGTVAIKGSGLLCVAPGVPGELIAERTEYIAVQGAVECSSGQASAIKERLRGRGGMVRNRDAQPQPRLEVGAEPQKHRMISGVAYLKL